MYCRYWMQFWQHWNWNFLPHFSSKWLINMTEWVVGNHSLLFTQKNTFSFKFLILIEMKWGFLLTSCITDKTTRYNTYATIFNCHTLQSRPRPRPSTLKKVDPILNVTLWVKNYILTNSRVLISNMTIVF